MPAQPPQDDRVVNPFSQSSDCARCAALCCVAFAFDTSPDFGHDKPNAQACKHLDKDLRCRIYADRAGLGYGGCLKYECLGVGQYVIQELFDGRSWRDDPELMEPISRCFLQLTKLNELLGMIDAAFKLKLDAPQRAELRDLLSSIPAAENWTVGTISGLDVDGLTERLKSIVASGAVRLTRGASTA